MELRKSFFAIMLGWLLALPVHAAGHAVVFMYHRFAEPAHPSTNITREQFAAHLEHLQENGYRVWPLGKVVTYLREGRELPDRTVAITIDDAYRSVHTVAWPLLREYGYPFTVFVSTGAVDKGLEDFMSWEQMRAMQEGGATFANHTVSHAYLLERREGETAEAWRRRVQGEIVHSQARLQKELGAGTNESPRLFAWPYGEYNSELASMLTSMGYTGFGQQSGVAWQHGDMAALPRYPLNEAYGELDSFATKAASLPLPVAVEVPADPTAIVGQNPPRLLLTLREGSGSMPGLACYIEGVRLEPELAADGSFSVVAENPLRGRRSRYNCTAPAGGGRYYWYSHLWVQPGVGP